MGIIAEEFYALCLVWEDEYQRRSGLAGWFITQAHSAKLCFFFWKPQEQWNGVTSRINTYSENWHNACELYSRGTHCPSRHDARRLNLMGVTKAQGPGSGWAYWYLLCSELEYSRINWFSIWKKKNFNERLQKKLYLTQRVKNTVKKRSNNASQRDKKTGKYHTVPAGVTPTVTTRAYYSIILQAEKTTGYGTTFAVGTLILKYAMLQVRAQWKKIP